VKNGQFYDVYRGLLVKNMLNASCGSWVYYISMEVSL